MNHGEGGFSFVGLELRTVLLVSELFCMKPKRWLLTRQQGNGSTILGTVGWIQMRRLDRRDGGIDKGGGGGGGDDDDDDDKNNNNKFQETET